MINRIVLSGRLTKDPDLKYTSSGTAVVNFTLAVNRPFKNKDGNYDADFLNIVAWRNLAEIVANHLKKGSQCALDGRVQTRNYENNEGRRIYVTEVVADQVHFLGEYKKSENDDPFRESGGPVDINDEDLPF